MSSDTALKNILFTFDVVKYDHTYPLMYNSMKKTSSIFFMVISLEF